MKDVGDVTVNTKKIIPWKSPCDCHPHIGSAFTPSHCVMTFNKSKVWRLEKITTAISSPSGIKDKGSYFRVGMLNSILMFCHNHSTAYLSCIAQNQIFYVCKELLAVRANRFAPDFQRWNLEMSKKHLKNICFTFYVQAGCFDKNLTWLLKI